MTDQLSKKGALFADSGKPAVKKTNVSKEQERLTCLTQHMVETRKSESNHSIVQDKTVGTG